MSTSSDGEVPHMADSNDDELVYDASSRESTPATPVIVDESPLCAICRTMLDRFDAAEEDDTIIESNEPVEDRAARGCHLCVHFLSRLDRSGKRARASYRTQLLTSPENPPLDCTYVKRYPHDPGRRPFLFSASAIELRLAMGEESPLVIVSRLLPAKDLGPLRRVEDIGLSSASEASFTLARQWLTDCSAHHDGTCRVAKTFVESTFLPTRLVYVGKDHPPKPLLCRGIDLPQGTRYATLSHCWGKNTEPRKLLPDNLLAMSAEIVFDELPETFQDALVASQRLGIQYLWIDSLCIVQDSSKDWQRESSLMSKVYSDSFCNISATAASDGKQGLFFARDPVSIRQVRLRFSSHGERRIYNPCDEDVWARAIDESPLNLRAWVCQERLLSPCNLHFAKDQIFWECTAHTACETYPDGLPSGLDNNSWKTEISGFLNHYSTRTLGRFSDGSIDKKSIIYAHRVWERIVRVFSRGRLSYGTDRLVAVGGLAAAMNVALDDEYLAGMWRKHLLTQLLWYSPAPNNCGTGGYIAPSWSWASTDSPISDAYLEPNPGTTDLVKVIDVFTILTSDNLYGQVKDGRIVLEGKLARLEHVESEEISRYTVPTLSTEREDQTSTGRGEAYLEKETLSIHWDFHRDNISVSKFPQQFYLLPIYLGYYREGSNSQPTRSMKGLVLVPKGNLTPSFHRWGMFTAYNEECDQHIKRGCDYFNTIAAELFFEPLKNADGETVYGIWID